jgi:Cu/Ag efflux protein CusF
MKIVFILIAALTIASSGAWAQQAGTGTLTQIDRINRTITIKLAQSVTTGANTGGPPEEFKAQDGLSLDALHAGDMVTFSFTEAGGIKTITTLHAQ